MNQHNKQASSARLQSEDLPVAILPHQIVSWRADDSLSHNQRYLGRAAQTPHTPNSKFFPIFAP